MVRSLGTYDKRTFIIKALEQKVLGLEAQTEKMKCCGNCKNRIQCELKNSGDYIYSDFLNNMMEYMDKHCVDICYCNNKKTCVDGSDWVFKGEK